MVHTTYRASGQGLQAAAQSAGGPTQEGRKEGMCVCVCVCVRGWGHMQHTQSRAEDAMPILHMGFAVTRDHAPVWRVQG